MKNRKDATPLIVREVAIVTLARGTIVKVNGLPVELISDDAQFKLSDATDLRFLGRAATVVKKYEEKRG